MSKHWSDDLPENACREAVIWARTQKSPQKAWDACERGDWMLDSLVRRGANHKKVLLVTCECARLSLKYTPENEKCLLRVIETAERWITGKATIGEIKTAASVAAVTFIAPADPDALIAAAAAAFASTAFAATATAAAAFTPSVIAANTAAAAAFAAASAALTAIPTAPIITTAASAAASAAAAISPTARDSLLLEEAKIVRKYFPKYPKPRKALKRKEA
jgi:hypothetical protein